jgi:glycerophosphoryl diester phosphodiesterase
LLNAAPGWLTARPIAHRGLHDRRRGRVENSLAAARAALAGDYAIECDVRLSRDGKIIVFHDNSLLRLCGVAAKVVDLDAAALLRTKFSDSDETVASLDQLLATVAGATPLIIEMKSDFSGNVQLAAALAAALADYVGPVAVKSFDPALVAALRAAQPAFPLGIVAQADYADDEWAGLTADQRFGLSRFTHAAQTRPDFLSWRALDLPQPAVELLRACAAMPVMTWTIRTPQQAQRVRPFADQIVFEGFLA